MYIDTYNDQNALYTQGRTTLPGGSASKRYNMGLEAGRKLVQQILAGEVELTDDETIKLVGHSQGAAYAAGIAQALIDAADLVTEMCDVKHYYTQGVLSRDGIDR